MAHPGGRPTKLTKALIDKANAYLDGCEGVGVHTLLPTVEGLALELHISRETIYQWAERPQFSDIYTRLQAAQANKLIQNGLAGRYNATIASLLMSKHGYVRQSDVTSGGEKMESVVIYRPEKLPDDYGDGGTQA